MPLELTEDEMGTTGWAVTLLAGHFGHGGWTVGGRDGVFTCACGTQLFELRAVGWQAGLLLSDECRRGDHRACDGAPCEDPLCHIADVPGVAVLVERRTPLTRTTGLAQVVPLRPVSNKRQRENRERRKVVQALWPDRPPCSFPQCSAWADDVHEPLFRSRLGSVTDPANMRPLCRPHHDWVPEHTDEAEALGLAVHSWDGPPEEVALVAALIILLLVLAAVGLVLLAAAWEYLRPVLARWRLTWRWGVTREPLQPLPAWHPDIDAFLTEEQELQLADMEDEMARKRRTR
jgi:hypothetical protein